MMQGIQNLLTAPRFPSDTRQNSMPRALFTSSFRLFFLLSSTVYGMESSLRPRPPVTAAVSSGR